LSAIRVINGPIVDVPGEEFGGAIASCPPGMSAISGGGEGKIAAIVDSEASSEGRGGWLIIVYNRFPATTVEIHAQVLCAGSGQAVAATARPAVRMRMEERLAALVAKLREQKAG
jgi:hypothetical protein